MSKEEPVSNKAKYYTVHDGTFRVQVPSNHPEAVERRWETKDGKSGIKYERHVRALFGKVENITIQKGDYGTNLNIFLDENEDGETPVISLPTNSRYGEDILKKLPNITNQEYRFMPFDFEDKENPGRQIRGISITSRDDEGKFSVKVQNFFYDGTKNINGYPDPTDEDREDWEFYFKKANKFLVKYAEDNILTKYIKGEKAIEYPEEIDTSAIPF